MSKQLTITEARGRLMDLPEEFSHDKKLDAIEITRRGKPVLAVMPWEDYETMRETLEVLADETTMESIRRGLEDVHHKRTTPLSDARKDLGL